jgi:hypothetical protein
MPQLSSTDRLIMAAKNMRDALKILIWRCHSLPSEMTPSQPLQSWRKFSNSNYGRKSNSHPSGCASQGQSTYMPHQIIQSNLSFSHAQPRQRISQKTIHARDITNAPLLPRVVTPITNNNSPPRVPTRSQNLSPHKISQDD